jgi:hypothetical protein
MDGQSESSSEGHSNDPDVQVSRRKFVKRAATIGAAASAIAWTAPGMTSIALAGDDGKGGDGKGGGTVPVGTSGKGGGGGDTVPVGPGGGGGGKGGKGKGSPVPVGPGGPGTTETTSKGPGSSDTDTSEPDTKKGDKVPVGRHNGGGSGGTGYSGSNNGGGGGSGGTGYTGNNNGGGSGGSSGGGGGSGSGSGSGGGNGGSGGSSGDVSGLAAGSPSTNSGDPNAVATTGTGGALPFTGGNGRDLVLAGAGLVVLGRVLYELRRVGGTPENHTDDPPQAPTPA